ncbi:MAG: helix-turn-helix transcriptional regulator [Pseudomonadota bacterium]
MTSIYADSYKQMLLLLKHARKAAGFSQAQLAERLGKPQSYVSKSENGERRLDVIEFLNVCRQLGLDPYVLLREVEAACSR